MKILFSFFLLSRLLDAANLYLLDGNEIDVYDTRTNTKIQAIVGLPGNALGMDVSPDGSVGYVLLSDGSVTVIDTLSSTFIKNIPGVVSPTSTTGPRPVAFHPNGQFAYVLDYANNSIAIINSDFSLGGVTGTGLATPHSIAISSVGDRAYVTNHAGSSISVIDTSIQEIIGSISTPTMSTPSGSVATLDDSQIYVTDDTLHQVYVIDRVSGTIVNTITQDQGSFYNPMAIAFNPPSGAFAYIANFGNGTISIISTSSFDLQTVVTGTDPESIVFTPDDSNVYVLNTSSETITILDGSTNKVTGTITGPFKGTLTALGIAPGLPPPSTAINLGNLQ
jgi:YVTN family beta-propeller protein